MTTVREAVFALLRAHGIKTIFGNPGSTELPMFRDFPGDFRYILGLQESVVMAMADGYAQATGNAALVNLHSSAGTGHALGNLFTAFRNQAPVIVTAGQQARSILPFEPYLFADQPTEFPRPFIKWAVEPARAADVPRAIERAYHIAMTPPRGPTFVSVPIDDWDQPSEPLAPRRLAAANPGDPEAIVELANDLSHARRPALVLGAGVARDGAWDAVIALAERQGASVFVAPFACRNVFPEDHPQFAGFLPASREGIVSALASHDVVLALGGPLNLYHTEGAGPHIPPDAIWWLVSDNLAQLAAAPVGRAIVANTRAIATALLDTPVPGTREGFAGRSRPAAVDPDILDDALLMQRIAALRPAGAVVVEEAPSSRPAMQAHLPMVIPDSFYTTAGGGLGYALPASVGVALARPDRKTIALLGDGSAMYAIQGLFTAAQLRLPVSFIIVNNGRYEALHSFGRLFDMSAIVGTDLSGLDFCALAEGMGVAGKQVIAPGALDDALAWSFGASVPTLVEVILR